MKLLIAASCESKDIPTRVSNEAKVTSSLTSLTSLSPGSHFGSKFTIQIFRTFVFLFILLPVVFVSSLYLFPVETRIYVALVTHYPISYFGCNHDNESLTIFLMTSWM